LSRATWVREFARHKLENADPGSVLISACDDDTFPLWYVHDLLRVRPDVFAVDRVMTDGIWWNYDRDPSLWYLHRLRRQGISIPIDLRRDLPRRDYLAFDGYLIDLLNGPLRGRPICLTFLKSPAAGDPQVLFRWAAKHYRPVPIGLLLRLQPMNRPVDMAALIRENERQWARMPLPDLNGVRTDDEIDPAYVPNQYACSLVNFGGLYELAGDRARAGALYRRAAAWAPGYWPAMAALSSLRHAHAAALSYPAGVGHGGLAGPGAIVAPVGGRHAAGVPIASVVTRPSTLQKKRSCPDPLSGSIQRHAHRG
jgi:hypothetical protein